jgi:hypothetical protein
MEFNWGFQLKLHACVRLGEILAFHICFEMGIVKLLVDLYDFYTLRLWVCRNMILG